jgi:hypothetical protein
MSWKSALICPIPKSSDARDLANTRPISLTPIMSRILSGILAKRLSQDVAPALHPAQAAFLAGRTTLEHIMALRLSIEQAKDQGTQLHGLLIDVSKRTTPCRCRCSCARYDESDCQPTLSSSWKACTRAPCAVCAPCGGRPNRLSSSAVCCRETR